ncbi:MAG: efflux RND transporter periplasmic adaptor subunit [Bacteroidales bacterium]|nr:efflux RND transporter periplasmic adaptor subunit [Bacteroidales bacterium]
MKYKKIQPFLFGTIIISVLSCNQPDMNVSADIEVPVSIIEVNTASIEEFISSTGIVYPMKETTLSSEIAGDYHLQVNPETGKLFGPGDYVRQGTTMIKLEDEEYLNNLRIRSSEVDYEISKQEYEKQKSLYEKGGATLRELKNAEINLINTEYEIESNRINLAKMYVKAPFSGIIADLPHYTAGTKVNANTELVKLIDYSILYLECSLPEKYYENISKNLPVYITSYTHSSDTLHGTVTKISPEIDPESRTFKSFILVHNSNKKLLPGMFVKADMVVNSSKNTLIIPKEVIISRNRFQMVFVVENGVAHERIITTGLENEKSVEVVTGLEKGESIVSEGFETLRNESKVKVLR